MPIHFFGRKENKGVDYKARLEHKLYLARENPEPVFDLSDCALKVVPSGIYSLCKVFRKDALFLQENQLTSLNGGGNLHDLALIRILNLESNQLATLPPEISGLKSLQVLKVNNNKLKSLPDSVGELSKLKELCLSNNFLKSIPSTIRNLKSLQSLDLRSNKIKNLPKELCQAICLRELHTDCENMLYPPKEICLNGIQEIMKFLCKESGMEYVNPNDCTTDDSSEVSSSPLSISDLQQKEKLLQAKVRELEKLKEQRNIERLAVEKELEEQQKKELEIQFEMKIQKEKLIEDLMEQQNKLELEINKIQLKREEEHNQLIDYLQKVESTAAHVIKELLLLNEKQRVGSHALQQLVEQEREEEERLLNVRQEGQFSLRRRDILCAMEALLQQECRREEKLREYEEGRAETTRTLLSQEMEADHHLGRLIKDRGQQQTYLVRRLQQDAELQRAAVGALLERGDARSWGLAQEVAMVQAQLASLTAVEMERRRLEMNEKLVALSEKRTALSSLLVDLIGQQAERRQQLLDQLKELEKRNVMHTAEDFWLFQYQRLLDSRPQCLAEAERSVDQKLVHHLLLAGALHCLPLLARTLLISSQSVSSPFSSMEKSETGAILNLDHDALMNAGLKDERDRELVLRAVNNYNTEKKMVCVAPVIEPSAPEMDIKKEDVHSQTPPFISSNTIENCECAVCMDKVCEVIFIPCGHMCCCINCSEKFTQCPMCRRKVDQKIRVIVG